MHQFGDRIDEARPAQAQRLGVANDTQGHIVDTQLDYFNGTLGGAHAAADGRALEGRTGRRGGSKQAVTVAQH